MSYRERRRARRVAAMRPVAERFPQSVALMAISMGILGWAVFRNPLAGLAGGVATLLFGLWYWKAGGRGRRLLDEWSHDDGGTS